MEFGKAFTFPFEDQDWLKKIGIAALILLIPLVGGFVVAGYAAEITKRVIRRHPEVLPAWDDFGGYLVKGLQVAVIGVVYALPIILIQACSQTALFMGTENFDDTVMTIVTIATVCFGCLTFLLALALGMVLPAAIGNFLHKERLGAAFRFGEVFGLVRAAPGAFALALLGVILAGIIGSLGTIACAIGVLFTGAYATAINGHLQGQAFLAGLEAKGGDSSFSPNNDATMMAGM
jgi:hypothetical protein